METYRMNGNTVRICGKTKETEQGLMLVSSGAFLEFSGEIGNIRMKMAGSDGDRYYDAYFGIFLNGSRTPEKIWKVKEGICNYEVFSRKQKEQVTVKIVKLTEMQYGTAEILELAVDGEVLPTGEREHQILFVGDSLTAGYGVSGSADDLIFTTETEDVTKGYSYLAAETLHADAWFACCSGGGITSRWIPPEEKTPLTDILMPEVFEKSSSEVLVPEVIAVNLGTNDASYTRGDATKEAAFTERYAAFVKKLAKRYPDAYILLLYGLMETTLTEAVKKAEEQCWKAGVKCTFTELPLSDKQDGYGTGEHPSAVTHKKTALVTARAIAQVTGWKE